MCLQAGIAALHTLSDLYGLSAAGLRQNGRRRLVFSILQGLSHREGENDWILTAWQFHAGIQLFPPFLFTWKPGWLYG